MGALAHGDNFNRLGPLRLEFMSLVGAHRLRCAGKPMSDFLWQVHGEKDMLLLLRALSHTTRRAQARAYATAHRGMRPERRRTP